MRYVDLSNKRHIRSAIDLPDGFAYPDDFLSFILANDGFPCILSPWTTEADWEDVETRISKHLGLSVVIFALAQLEDIVACFTMKNSYEIGVVVVAPFLHREENGVWHQDKCATHAQLESFTAWLAWTRNNTSVQLDNQPYN